MGSGAEPARPRRVLVLGASSFLGRALCRQLGPDRTLGTFRSVSVDGAVRFDAVTDSLEDLLEGHESFDWSVLLFGIPQPDPCARDPEGSRQLNVDRTLAIAGELNRRGCPILFTSTEVVFDGTQGPYDETRDPRPLLLYARQKVEVERRLQDLYPDSLIIRLPRLYGQGRGDGTLFMDWLDRLERGEDIRCAEDHVFSPIHVDDAARGLVMLMGRGASGTWHLASRPPMSRIAMLRVLIDNVGEQLSWKGRVIPCCMGDFPTLEPRPRDVSLDPGRFEEATGWAPRTVVQFCRQLRDELASSSPVGHSK